MPILDKVFLVKYDNNYYPLKIIIYIHMKFRYLLIFLICFSSVSFADKTDIIILKNGDKITGEVKGMQFALLTLKTDAMSTIEIKWEDIRYVKSKYSFRIERVNGVPSFGIINTDTVNNELIVGFDPYIDKIKMDKVVYLIPVKKIFYDALSMAVDAGFSFTKASNVLQLNFSGNGTHTTRKYQRIFDFTSIVTSQKDTTESQNHDYKIQVLRFLPQKWFLLGGAGAQKNTELGLDLRLYLSGGGGKDLIRTNSNVLSTGLGLQLTREWSNGVADAKNSIEGIFSVQYQKFRLTTPKLNWNTSLNAYPSLTTKDRVRLEFKTDLRWEIVKHLFWKLTFYDNYDNKPESDTGGSNDYGITVSLGWSHN